MDGHRRGRIAVTSGEIADALAAYQAGLEAEIALLRQLQMLSDDQRTASRAQDLVRVERVGDERERLMAAVVRIEHEIAPIRLRIAEHRQQACASPAFPEVAELHRTARELVAGIMTSDGETLGVLRDADLARRLASGVVDAGEQTLAAYRRVVTPALNAPTLVNRRG
jgi:hypothetical protein